jgi:nucleoside-diphosphate-sugar epimerase
MAAGHGAKARPAQVVFVSGVTGNLGSAVTIELIRRAVRVRGLVRDEKQARITLGACFKAAGLVEDEEQQTSQGENANERKGDAWRMLDLVVGDLTEVDTQTEGLLLAAMRDCDVVLHCAGVNEGWQVLVIVIAWPSTTRVLHAICMNTRVLTKLGNVSPLSVQADSGTWDRLNLGGTQSLLDIAGQSSVRQFVMISALEVSNGVSSFSSYPQSCPPLKKPQMGHTPYQQSKIGAQNVAAAAHRKYTKMNVVVLSPGAFYGQCPGRESLLQSAPQSAPQAARCDTI